MTINTDYPCASGNYTKGRTKNIEYIVIHYVGATGTALQNAKYFSNNTNLKASAHYFVGHKSEGAAIYQSVKDSDTAWHCGTTGAYKHAYCRNSNSIGIELCCHNSGTDLSASSGTWYFDDETISAGAELTKMLMAKYKIDTDHVLRHYDVTGKTCPAPFVNDGNVWTAFKNRLKGGEMGMTIKDVSVKMGDSQVPAKLIDGVTYVPLREFVEAIKTELDVTWSAEAGAGVEL